MESTLASSLIGPLRRADHNGYRNPLDEPRRIHSEALSVLDAQRLTAALAASSKLGRTIRPVALGPRAALGAVEARLSPSQIMWTPADFERAVRATFGEDLRHWLIDPLPAPLL